MLRRLTKLETFFIALSLAFAAWATHRIFTTSSTLLEAVQLAATMLIMAGVFATFVVLVTAELGDRRRSDDDG